MFTIIKNTKNPIRKISEDTKSLSEIIKLDDKISLNIVEVVDYHEKVTAGYNRIYYISDGTMDLFINGQEIQLQKGDACYVQKGTNLALQGTFNAIIVSQPQMRL